MLTLDNVLHDTKNIIMMTIWFHQINQKEQHKSALNNVLSILLLEVNLFDYHPVNIIIP